MNRFQLHFVRHLAFAVVAVSLLAMGVFARRGWLDWRRMVRQNEELAADIARVTSEGDALEAKIEKLKSDRREQERTIRRVLGYVRSDEYVIEF